MKKKNGRWFEGPSVRPRRGRNYDLTYDLIHRRFAWVCSQPACKAKWPKTGCASAGDAFGRIEGARIMLNRYLKGPYSRSLHTLTRWRYFIQISHAKYSANARRYAASYFGQNIVGRVTSILCLYYLHIIKRAPSLSFSVSLFARVSFCSLIIARPSLK